MSIISFENRFIFLKTRKVAGTSVEAVLRRFTGEGDIVPAVTPRDEYYSAVDGLFSKNYLKTRDEEKKYTDLVLNKEFKLAAEYLKEARKLASSHMGYQKICDIVKRNGCSIDDFFVFTIERHPYSWLLSKVLYSNEKYNSGSLVLEGLSRDEVNRRVQKFLAREDVRKHINWSMYSLNNKVSVDRVLEFESLDRELGEVLKKVGINEDFCLPELKSNSRHLDAFSLLYPEVKREALDVFREVFDYMDYRT